MALVQKLTLFVTAVLVSLLLSASRAHAREPAAPASAIDATLDTRAAELELILSEVQPPTRRYFAGWLSVMSATAVGQGAIGLFVDDPASRASLFLGAGLSVVGVGALLLTPFPGRHAADELRRMPARTLAEKRAKVARGEELLEGEAESVRFQRAWFQHALVGALSIGNVVFLGVRYPDDVWRVAVPSGIGMLAISELQIWTRPTAASDHWERYRLRVPDVAVAPWLAPATLGLSLHARF
jgi:hypothetical protein